MKNSKELAGFISEKEIDSLLGSENVNGGSELGTILGTIGLTLTVFAMTVSMDFCPTSACTSKC